MKQYFPAFLPLLLIATRTTGKKNGLMDSPNPLMSQCFFCATCILPPFVYSHLCTFAILIPAITRLAGHVGGGFARSQWMSQYSQRRDEFELLAGEEGGKCSGTCWMIWWPSCGKFRGVIVTVTFFFLLLPKTGSCSFVSKIIKIITIITTSKMF